MKIIYSFLLIFFSSIVLGQVRINEVNLLPELVKETSGLEYFKGNLLTHNDSGDATFLYEIDQKGTFLKQYLVSETSHQDWEDITYGNSRYYVGDFGNNFGTRKDLKIYILDKQFKQKGTIQIEYAKQQSFEFRRQHAFDAEALIFFKNSLILFSKNRANFTTQVYQLPTKAGSYKLTSLFEFDVKCLITGADFNKNLDLLVLVGYDQGKQFLFTFSDFNMENLEKNPFTKNSIPIENAQIEGVKIIDQNTFWVTTESLGEAPAKLLKISLD